MRRYSETSRTVKTCGRVGALPAFCDDFIAVAKQIALLNATLSECYLSRVEAPPADSGLYYPATRRFVQISVSLQHNPSRKLGGKRHIDGCSRTRLMRTHYLIWQPEIVGHDTLPKPIRYLSSLLYKVLTLTPRVAAARVLLPRVNSMVRRINSFSTASSDDPIGIFI
jgi:hypothetical protein